MAKIHNLSATALALVMNKIINFSYIQNYVLCSLTDEATDATNGVVVMFQL